MEMVKKKETEMEMILLFYQPFPWLSYFRGNYRFYNMVITLFSKYTVLVSHVSIWPIA